MRSLLLLPLLLLLTMPRIFAAPSSHQACAAFVNKTICSRDSPTTASWCSFRNPYLTPRFLNQKDGATLENLAKLASPVCTDGICYMFSRFFATTFRGRPLFIANVVSNDSDTNRLLPIDGLTYKQIPGLAPGVALGSRYGDIGYTDALANANDYLGVSMTVNPQKLFKSNVRLSPVDIMKNYAFRYSGVYITEPDDGQLRPLIPAVKDTWIRYGYLSYFADFVSVSSSAASSDASSLVDTEEGGWWIYPNGEATYVTLAKHTEFDIYRITFVPGNYTKAVDQIQIWEIDREPVDATWAERSCPETDPEKLQKLIFESSACQSFQYLKVRRCFSLMSTLPPYSFDCFSCPVQFMCTC